jgi:hypothetical protein
MASPPTLAELFRRALEAQRQDLHTAIPGKVVKVNTSGGNITSVDAQPLIRGWYESEEGEQVMESMPVIPQVPVLFPGGGGYRVTVPIEAGDTVLLVFSEASIDRWFHTGNESDPDVGRRHHLTDAVAIPGLRANPGRYTAPADKMSIGPENGPAIELDGITIALGSSGEAVALGNVLQTWANAINAWAVATQTALSSVPIPVAPAPPASAPILASSVVKVQP